MNNHTIKQLTASRHSNQQQLKSSLITLFLYPDPEYIARRTIDFLRRHPLPLNDFPRVEGTYSRTIVHRSSNGFEALAARWSKGTLSSIHGHPFFVFLYVVEGELKIDDYRRKGTGLARISSECLRKDDYFFLYGTPDTFDNHIHQVQANEETLSIHISSDDSAKGHIFDKHW